MKILIGVVFIILLCCHPVLANQLRQPATLLDITLSQLNHLSFQGEYERQRKLNSSTEKPEPDEFGLVEKFTLFKRDRNFKVNINVILESTAANMTRALCEKKKSSELSKYHNKTLQQITGIASMILPAEIHTKHFVEIFREANIEITLIAKENPQIVISC